MSRLTVAEKRKRLVVVAKDVIKQLKLKRFAASPGTYLQVIDADRHVLRELDDKEFQLALRPVKCEVCAIGACFVSYVDKYDGIPGSDLIRADDVMIRTFGSKTMLAMERVFEGFGGGKRPSKLYKKLWRKAETSGEYYEDEVPADKRMTLIMRNIIANKGEFKP